MACACKTAKKIDEKERMNVNDRLYEQKGVFGFIRFFLVEYGFNFLSRILYAIVMILICPILGVVLACSILFNGTPELVLPSAIKKMFDKEDGEELQTTN